MVIPIFFFQHVLIVFGANFGNVRTLTPKKSFYTVLKSGYPACLFRSLPDLGLLVPVDTLQLLYLAISLLLPLQLLPGLLLNQSPESLSHLA